jgi:hypothetical protein
MNLSSPVMRKNFALVFCLLLAGCTDSDWDRALNYVYPAPDDADLTSDASPPPASQPVPQPATTIAAPAAAPPAAASPNADFCRAVATQDATRNGFDPPTQQRVFARSYGQCVAMYGR